MGNLTNRLTSSRIVLTKDPVVNVTQDYTVANAVMPTDEFCSNYAPKSSTSPTYDKQKCLEEILYVQQAAQRGQLTQSHAMGPPEDDQQREFVMACFLVAAGNLSYFAYADWSHGWSLQGYQWWPEYDYNLGNPLGDAKRNGWRFTRSFSSGTSVAVDVEAHTANIQWASAQFFM